MSGFIARVLWERQWSGPTHVVALPDRRITVAATKSPFLVRVDVPIARPKCAQCSKPFLQYAMTRGLCDACRAVEVYPLGRAQPEFSEKSGSGVA